MEIVKLKLSKIKPYAKNPRKNDGAVDAVAESIRQCGYCAPIVVDEDYVILAGHTRYKALKKLGWAEAEVVVREGLTAEQKRKYRLLDNKTNELSQWDFELLAGELEGLDFNGFDFGFDLPNDDNDEAVDDDYDVVLPEEPTTKPGDLFALGDHRLLCGDSTKVEAIAQLCGGRAADLLLTDPPYNVNYQGGKIANDNMADADFYNFLVSAFGAAKSGLRPGAAFYIWHADSEGYNFRGAARDAGLKVRQCLIWVKNSLVLGRQDYQWQHEPCLYGWPDEAEDDSDHDPCLYGWVDGAAHSWYANRKQTTVLTFDKPRKNAEHPTMKPVPLFGYLIQNSSKPGDVVLDTFAGSGTTIIACEQLKRAAFCCELDPKYCDVIINRWETFTGEKAVLLNG